MNNTIVTDGKLTYGGLLFLGTNAAITDHFSDFRVDYLEIPATNYADAEPRYTFRVEELMKTDETLPRNPVLAKFFRLAKLCESAGYGFDKMLQWKKQTGNEVLFETSIDKTKFTFMIDTTKVIGEESGTKIKTVEETTGKQPENNQKTTRRNKDINYRID
ncbi:hypothetical protein AGMMS4957_15560 [Bacteroidia bacterium]|nr:hypothetical protein AGMMS4957_15560 [Bacteroidia bacterium]